jgi:predicted secreted Zn-dependent protease
MTRDVGTIFDELKALADRHAEMHADRARLQAELERARRSWWRRLWGVEQ